MIRLPTEFRAHLESYQGPLDLLLYLIRKEEVDVLDIPISRITEQYLAYLALLQAIDPNVCGEFLVMAANLMEIKSRTLLPTEPVPEGEEPEDPRLELVRQLLEYKKYKERALLLEERLRRHSRRYGRPSPHLPSGEEGEEAGPLELGNVSVWDLLTAFHRIQLAIGQRGPHRVVFEDRPLEDYVAAVRARAEASPSRRLAFEEVFEDCRDLYDAIGYFLAILEMAKRRLLEIHQEEAFGPIEVVLLDPEEAETPQGPEGAVPGGEGAAAGLPPPEAPSSG